MESLAKDEGRYVQFLEGVIVQGFLQILELEVTVYARKKDVAVVSQAAEAAAKTYTDLSGRKIKFDVEGTLSDDSYVRAVSSSGLGLTFPAALAASSSSAGLVVLRWTTRLRNG